MLNKFLTNWNNSILIREYELLSSFDDECMEIIELRSAFRELKADYINETYERQKVIVNRIAADLKSVSRTELFLDSLKTAMTMKTLQFIDSALYAVHMCFYLRARFAPEHQLHMLEKRIVSALS